MKHLSVIQIEFLKSAVWDDRPYGFQKRYIRQHPKSKYRVTAPLSEEKCKNCGGRLKIKDHGKWEGYYCPQCGTGGSRQKRRQIRRMPVRHNVPESMPKQVQLDQLQHRLGIESVIDIKPEFYDKEKKSFAFEISEVENASPTQIVYLKNPKTGVKMKFTQYKVDKDASDEDTYGWHYKSDDDKYELLIIND